VLLLFTLPHHPKNGHENKHRCTPVLLPSPFAGEPIYYLAVLVIQGYRYLGDVGNGLLSTGESAENLFTNNIVK
jgi:hypothetical protein